MNKPYIKPCCYCGGSNNTYQFLSINGCCYKCYKSFSFKKHKEENKPKYKKNKENKLKFWDSLILKIYNNISKNKYKILLWNIMESLRNKIREYNKKEIGILNRKTIKSSCLKSVLWKENHYG